MSNHFHLAFCPIDDGDLSDFMQWLMTAHVCRYHKHYHSNGHIWQGRFRAHPIQENDHLLTVLRYIERNPLRAGLVDRAEDWKWPSASAPRAGWPKLDPGPVARPINWRQWVNEPQAEAEIESLRGEEKGTRLVSVRRKRVASPFLLRLRSLAGAAATMSWRAEQECGLGQVERLARRVFISIQ
jgi:hypothetical protein